MRKLLQLCLTTFLFAVACQAATASPQTCADRSVVIEHLADRYGETRIWVALGHDGTMVETFAALNTGTWSLIVTRPGGATCLVAAGQSFQLTTREIEPTGAPIRYSGAD